MEQMAERIEVCIIVADPGEGSIMFDIGGVNLIIVNCHLAAHMEQMAERIEVCIIVADPEVVQGVRLTLPPCPPFLNILWRWNNLVS